jgi:glycerol uptake facilitator-like aquaporin
MLREFIAEFLGTFFFLGVILVAVDGLSKKVCSMEKSQAYIRIGLALSIAIVLVGSISGGHLNPAVSFMFYLKNELKTPELLVYVCAQLFGALCAFGTYHYLYEAKSLMK